MTARYDTVLATVEPAREDYIYAAGFFDGEGCISITTNGQGKARLTVVIGQKNRAVLDWFSARWGARVVKPPSQNVFRWQVNGRYAVTLLSDLLPFLKEKRTQAVLALNAFAADDLAGAKAQLAALKRGESGS